MGTRLRQYHMLCGALLRIWKHVSNVVADVTNSSILQIVRLKTKDSNKQVGEFFVVDLSEMYFLACKTSLFLSLRY